MKVVPSGSTASSSSSSSSFLLLVLLASTDAGWTNDDTTGGDASQKTTASVKKLEQFWTDPAEIIADLHEYQALWIKPHGCVWSECAVDDTDDQYQGDNRDGDEQWYQYRTQEFCANAAYALYGIPRNAATVTGCSRGNFINSFFTYGGADNMLLAVGKDPTVYYNNDDDNNNNNNNEQNNNNNNNNQDGSSSTASNSDCVEIDNPNQYQYQNDDQQQQQNGNNRALSDSGDGGDDDYGYSSTMGCSVDGDYAIAGFEANNCNGNYYDQTLDVFKEYNKQHQQIGCHRIWGRVSGDDFAAIYLLNNSWTCDLDLYPQGCPDPYGKKARYDYALRTIANGGNAQVAFTNMILKRPLRIASWILAFFGTFLAAFAYWMQHRERVTAKGGGLRGYFRCLGEDMSLATDRMVLATLSKLRALRKARRREARHARREERKASKRSVGERGDGGGDGGEYGDDDGVDAAARYRRDPEPVTKDEKKKKKKKGRRSKSRSGKKTRSSSKKDRYTTDIDGRNYEGEYMSATSGELA